MKRWVLVLVADYQYMKWAYLTVQMARTTGEWTEDIVILCPPDMVDQSPWKELAEQWHVTYKPIPPRDMTEISNPWLSPQAQDYPEYYYIAVRPNIYYKFYIFDEYFKAWDVVFYVDASCRIQHPLSRFQTTCEPQMCLYAHSNCYPTYEWKLKQEFMEPLFDASGYDLFQRTYDLEREYFQSTILLYDTRILKPGTVDRLFELAAKYPTTRGDQGILNLYFQFEHACWTQIPLRDEQGWLYDFHERGSHKQEEYCILKKPLAEMNVRR